MDLSKFNFFSEPFKALDGIETELDKRQSRSQWALYAGIFGLAVQVIGSLNENNFFEQAVAFFASLCSLHFSAEGLLEALIVLLTFAGFFFYLLYKKTKIFLKESSEPFRYTFSIGSFTEINLTTEEGSSPAFKLTGIEKMGLMDYDLKEMLNRRIKRFSLLEKTVPEDEKAASEFNTNKSKSHFEINGEFTIRQNRNEEWIVYIFPHLRIGTRLTEIIIDPIKYPLKFEDAAELKKRASARSTDTLTHTEYYQIVERVFSKIVSEIYKQIKTDLDEKIKLFPTSYLKAVGLENEAYDFERSNTIDAYDNAISLYEKAYDRFRLRWFSLLPRLSLSFWFLWISRTRKKLMESRAVIGKCRCMVYRNFMASYSGRAGMPLFAVPLYLDEMVLQLTDIRRRLEKSKRRKAIERMHNRLFERREFATNENKSSVLRKNFVGVLFSSYIWKEHQKFQSLKNEVLDLLFQTHAILTISYRSNTSLTKAITHLELSKDVATGINQMQPNSDLLSLIAASEAEPVVGEKIKSLIKATELDPNFEIPQFLLARAMENDLRLKEELTSGKIQVAIDQYERAVILNPSNIGALSSLGFLNWVKADFTAAKTKYEEGIEVKSNISDTYVGDLMYGLARVLAEQAMNDPENLQEKITTAVSYFDSSIKLEPSLAAYALGRANKTENSNFDYIGRDVYLRFEEYAAHVKSVCENLEKQSVKETDLKSNKTLCNYLSSYVLNDAGNAAFNLYIRTRLPALLSKATEHYERAVELHGLNAVANYNLHMLVHFDVDDTDKIVTEKDKTTGEDRIKLVYQLMPGWLSAVVEYSKILVKKAKKDSGEITNKLDDEIQAIKEQISQITFQSWGLNLDINSSSPKLNSDSKTLIPDLKNDLNKITGSAPQVNVNANPEESTRKLLLLNEKLNKLKARRDEENNKGGEQEKLSDLFNKNIKTLIKENVLRKNITAEQFEQLDWDQLLSLFCKDLTTEITKTRGNKFPHPQIFNLRKIDFDALSLIGELSIHFVNNFNEGNRYTHVHAAVKTLYQFLVPLSNENFDLNIALLQFPDEFKIPEELNLLGCQPAYDRIFTLVKFSLREDPFSVNLLSWLPGIQQNQFLSKKAAAENASTFFFSAELKEALNKIEYRSTENNFSQSIIPSLPYVADYFNGYLCWTALSFTNGILSEFNPQKKNMESFAVIREDLKRMSGYFKKYIEHDTWGLHNKYIEEQLKIISKLKTWNIESVETDQLALDVLVNPIFDKVQTESIQDFASLENSMRKNWKSLENFFATTPAEKRVHAIADAIAEKAKDSKTKAFWNEEISRRKNDRLTEDHYGKNFSSKTYWTTPIRADLSASLLKLILDETGAKLSEDFLRRLEKMRSEVKDQLGFTLPGVLFGAGNYGDRSLFVISLRGTPKITVYVQQEDNKNMKYCLLSKKELEEHKITFQDDQYKPAGITGCWVSASTQVPDGLQSFFLDETDYLLWYLKNYLIVNFWQLIDYEQFIYTVNSVNINSDSKTLLLERNHSLLAYEVIKSLLLEVVTIHDVAAVLNLIANSIRKNLKSVDGILKHIRMHDSLRELLRGNNADHTHHRLPAKAQQQIESALVTGENGQVLLNIDPTECQEVLAEIRTLLTESQLPALITKPELRLPTYRLLRLEWPNVPVLSTDELLPYLTAQ